MASFMPAEPQSQRVPTIVIPTSVVLVPPDHFSLVLVLVFGFEIILVSFSSSTASL